MRDVDLGFELELLELGGERLGTEMARHLGELTLLVRERGFDDQELQIRDAVHLAPELVVRAGIAGEHQARGAAVEVVTDRRYRVPRRQRREAARAEAHRLADLDLLVAQKRRLGARDLAEVGPDGPIEQVVAHDLDRRPGRVHDDRLRAHGAHRIDQERDRRHVVEMRMGNEDRIDLRQLGEGQIADAGAGVDQDIVINEERRRA